MDTKERCQSCGMPLAEGSYGTNADGSPNHDYCKYCFQDGSFTDPNMTKEKMTQLSIEQMTTDQQMSVEEATRLANEYIPHLSRWRG